MSQYQPPQGTPGPHGGGQPQYGHGSVPQQPAGPSPGYGASSAPHAAPQAGAFGQQPDGSPYPAAPYSTASDRPGLFDTTFATPSTPRTAGIAYVAIIVLAAAFALGGLLGAISSFSIARQYGDVTNALSGVVTLLKGFALGFAILAVGRLFVDFFVQQHRAIAGKG